MNPGKLDILGTIQYNAGTKNAAGETVDNWVTEFSMWMQKITLSGTETVAADQIIGFTRHEFKCRTFEFTRATQKMRLLITPRVYDIIELVYIDRMYSKLICQERDND